MTRNNRGFAIVEVLVAAALLGGIALAISKLTQDQLKSTKTVETRFEYNAILNDIREILGSRQSCQATFIDQNAINLPAGTVTKIMDTRTSPPSERFIANTDYNSAPQYGAGGTIRILSFRLSSTIDPETGFSGTSRVGTTNLYVKFAFGTDKTYSSNTIERKIKLNVTTHSVADRRILDCSSTGAQADYELRYVNVNGDYMDGPLEIQNGAWIDIRPGASIQVQNGSNITLNGNAYIDFLSDRRLKEDVTPLPKVLKKLSKLRPVTYNWKEDGKADQGLIAQEVKKIFPHLVHETASGYYSVNYIMLTPLLIKSVQELDAENRQLKNQLHQIRNEQNKINTMIHEMRKENCLNSPQSEICK